MNYTDTSLMRTKLVSSNLRRYTFNVFFFSFYQYMEGLEQEARLELDPGAMEFVLVAMVLVQGVMVQDPEVTGLAQAGQVLVVVLGVLEHLELEESEPVEV